MQFYYLGDKVVGIVVVVCCCIACVIKMYDQDTGTAVNAALGRGVS